MERRTEEGAAGTGSAEDDFSTRLTCSRCGPVIPRVYHRGPHLRADCPRCYNYLAFVPKATFWLEMAGEMPLGPLFEGGE